MYSTGQIPDLTQWEDLGLGGYDESDGQSPEDWRRYGIEDFGAHSEFMGIMDGQGLALAAEVTPEMYGNRVVARTPMLELDPEDYRYMNVMKRPYDGMMALGDDGSIYEFDGTLGFFKKLFRGVKKIARRVRRGVRKIIKKIPGGKYLIRLGKKVWGIAKKFVRPLARFVGKYAAKLAPVAALIPGYGPAIAAGLYTAGKIANLMNKWDVKITGAAGKLRKIKFPSGKTAKRFQAQLKKMAKAEKRRQARGGKIKKIGRPKRRRRRRRKIKMSPMEARFMRSMMKKRRRGLARRGRARRLSARRV